MTSCASHRHVVGSGAKENKRIERKQFYFLFNLVPFNYWETISGHVNTAKIAGEKTEDYEIKTYTSFVDGAVYLFTSGILGMRTVVVIK